jgi:hypothetical protein
MYAIFLFYFGGGGVDSCIIWWSNRVYLCLGRILTWLVNGVDETLRSEICQKKKLEYEENVLGSRISKFRSQSYEL